MTTLLLIRHGQSEWNRDGRIQGQVDTPLTALGQSQALAIGAVLARKVNLAELPAQRLVFFSSPMLRAQETAQLIALQMGGHLPAIIVDARLNDYHQGQISGTYGWDQVGVDYPELARLRLEDPLRYHPPGGESGKVFWERLQNFLDSLDADPIWRESVNVIVSHGIVNKYIRSIRRKISGAGIIALDEAQDTVFRLDGDVETKITAEN